VLLCIFFALEIFIYFITQTDSEDEREKQAAKVALAHRLTSQSNKSSRRNRSRLPRTAGLRTLNELTTELANAGLDPSKIQARAEMLVSMRAAKRKRESDMDVDTEPIGDTHEDDWMDVDDDDEQKPMKRTKLNRGLSAAWNGRAARTNRQLAGLRDAAVRPL
jgi:nucleolar GTP-binding protein